MGNGVDTMINFMCRGGFHYYRFLPTLMSLNPPCLNEKLLTRQLQIGSSPQKRHHKRESLTYHPIGLR